MPALKQLVTTGVQKTHGRNQHPWGLAACRDQRSSHSTPLHLAPGPSVLLVLTLGPCPLLRPCAAVCPGDVRQHDATNVTWVPCMSGLCCCEAYGGTEWGHLAQPLRTTGGCAAECKAALTAPSHACMAMLGHGAEVLHGAYRVLGCFAFPGSQCPMCHIPGLGCWYGGGSC